MAGMVLGDDNQRVDVLRWVGRDAAGIVDWESKEAIVSRCRGVLRVLPSALACACAWHFSAVARHITTTCDSQSGMTQPAAHGP